MGDERFRLRAPGAHLVSLEMHKISTVVLLTTLEEVIIEASQLSGDDAGSHVMAIEEATSPCVFGRKKSSADWER